MRSIIDCQLENPGDHDHRLRTVPVLEHCELQGFSATDEESAAQPLLILHDPVAMAVLADAEQGRCDEDCGEGGSALFMALLL